MDMVWEDLAHLAWLATPVWVFDYQASRIVWANPAAVELWRAASADELYARDLATMSVSDATRLQALVREVFDGKVAKLPWILYPGGQPTPLNLTVRALHSPAGVSCLCVEALPAERIDAAALRGVEAVLHFSLTVVMFDLAGRVLMQNPAAMRAFPQLVNEPGNGFLCLLEKPEEAERIWRDALENGADQGERLFSAKPRPRWYAYSLHRALDPVSGKAAMLFSGQDVTERVLSEKKFRVLFEQSANPMLLFDPVSGKVSDCNRAASQALRLPSRKHLVDADPAQFYPPTQPDGRPSYEKAREIAESTLKRGWHRFEWMFRRADGGELLVEITLSPVQLGDAAMLLGVWYDLSLRRLVERQLLAAKEVAETASLAKSQFLANMSHEIRTPLNAIVGVTELLSQTTLSESQHEWLDIIRFSSVGLVELVGDILDFSRIEAGKLALELRVFDLRAMVANTVELLRFRADEKGLLLNLSMDAAIPRWVEGDEARLRQVLVNLLGNAVKFTAHGSVMLDLRLMQHDGADWVRAEVRDTGIGIEPAKLGTIFDAFSQADDTISRRYGGSGLGLTISRRLIDAMGGALRVESTFGRGSTFSFELPLKPADEPQQPEALAQPALLPSMHILLAEDNLINQRLAVALLEKAGHRVTVAGNGQEAIERFVADRFDLVLMDMQMPEMDGLQATRAIRVLEGERHTPIVAMTANVMPEDRARCFDAGMDDFISKPISMSHLNQVLQQAASLLQAAEAAAPEPTPASSDAFSLDLALASCGGNADLLEELAVLFEGEWPNRKAALQSALAASDIVLVGRTAHMLKGSFGALASSSGGACALKVDQAAKRGELEADDVAALCLAGDALCAALAGWRQGRR
ncbi:ATP-binding protein [Chitinimonas sp.]|uniref:ATP-binding protein n=1 Tax=Chitinimonas sp. TaxID=1934313 RepID=UPI0035B43179